MFSKMRYWIMQTLKEMWQNLNVRLSALLVLLFAAMFCGEVREIGRMLLGSPFYGILFADLTFISLFIMSWGFISFSALLYQKMKSILYQG